MTRIGDFDVLPLNLGGNVFGWTADEPTSFQILDAFVDAGGSFVDTADMYSAWIPGNTGGDSERVIGSWLRRSGRRDDLVIATKVAKHPEFPGLSPANIRAALDASLSRLGTDHVDVYYAHFDDPAVPMPDIVGTLSALIDAGKVRHIAISNFSPGRIDEWFAATEADGLHRAVALQPGYSLADRSFETNGLREAAQRHDLAVLPFSALASGFLTGKYRPGVEVSSPRAGGASRFLDDRGLRILAALDEVALPRQAEVATVALAWLRHRPTIAAPIASASRLDQLPALLASAHLTLEASEVELLDAASA